MKNKILIIGGGELGQALRLVLRGAGHRPLLFDRNKEKSSRNAKLSDAREASVIFLAVPSWGLRPVLIELKPYLKKRTILVALSKGLEEYTHKSVDQIIREECGKQPIAVMSGPMLAEELTKNQGGAAVLATPSNFVYANLQKIFESSNLIIERSTDLRGVAVAGVLKNIYAIGIGAAEGIGWKSNLQGWLVSKSFFEISQLTKKLGGKEHTIFTPAALADFIATATSEFSKNRRHGWELAKYGQCTLRGEGFVSLVSLIHLIKRDLPKYPVLQALKAMIIDCKDVKRELQKLKIRQRKI